MPSKSVYTAESDLSIFEWASRLADGMSAAVVTGLRLYLAQHEKNRGGTGIETTELKVDDGGVVRAKHSSSWLLLRRKQNEGLHTYAFSVYATAHGQYAAHARDEPDWSGTFVEDNNSPLWENQETWGGEQQNTKHRELHVFRDITGMHGEIPDYLINETERAEPQPMVEDLDI